MHIIHLPTLAVSGRAANGNFDMEPALAVWETIRCERVTHPSSRRVITFEVCVELEILEDRAPQPNINAGASTPKTVIRKGILRSESRQIGWSASPMQPRRFAGAEQCMGIEYDVGVRLAIAASLHNNARCRSHRFRLGVSSPQC